MNIDLTKLFEDVNASTFVGLDTETEPKLKGGKKNPFLGRVKKHMEGASVMVFANRKSNGYENMVNRRLIQEGKDPESFTLGERVWGKRIPQMPIVEHNGQQYLEVIFLKPGRVYYTVDGQVVDPTQIEGLETEKTEGEQGGLSDENKVIIRTFKAESIRALRFNGVEVVNKESAK